MMKVLQILSTTSLSRGDFMVVMNYYRNINRENIVFDFAYINDCKDEAKEELLAYGSKVFKLTCPSIFNFAKTFKKELREILDCNQYDIIHLHMPTFQAFVKQVIKGKNIKLILHSHNTRLSDEFLRNLRNKFLVVGLNKNVDCRLACTELAGKKIFGQGFLTRNSDSILTNAINLEKFKTNRDIRESQRKELSLSDEDIAVCNVGRFVEQKNHTRLIDIFYEMCKKQSNLKLFLIGEGGLKENIKTKLDSLNLTDKVVFLGNRNDVNEVLQAMDLFVFPSLFEGLGIVLIEAQAAGLLCFSSDTCPKDVEVTDNIYRLPLSKDDKYWADFIIEKYFKGWERDTYNQIESSGYNIKKEASKLEDIYKQLLN